MSTSARDDSVNLVAPLLRILFRAAHGVGLGTCNHLNFKLALSFIDGAETLSHHDVALVIAVLVFQVESGLVGQNECSFRPGEQRLGLNQLAFLDHI